MSLESAQAIINQDITEIIFAVGEDNFQPLAGKELLITGVQGLLGGYITDTLAHLNETVLQKNPCWVMGLSRSPVTKMSRLGHLRNRHAMVLHQHDVTKPCHLYDPKFIIHAAGRSAPSTFTQDPIGTIDVNVSALRWLLELAVGSKAESFCWFSSSEIYGNPPPEYIPTPETYRGNSDHLGSRGVYTESKRCGEAMSLAFYIKYHVPVKIFRPALIYGPGFPIDDRRVLSDFVNSGIKRQPIQLKDNGLARRVYCYIKDAMIIFWKTFLSDKDGQVFNLGGIPSMEVSIMDLAVIVHKICQVKEEPILGLSPTMPGSPDRVCLDMTKAINMFGYTPITTLEEGLEKTIRWTKERLS